VSLKHQNAIEVIATIIGILSLLWGLFFVVLSLVDPVAPMIFLFAVPFVLLSLALAHKGWLIFKLYGALFVLSLSVAYWTVHDIEGKATLIDSSEPFKEDVFIKCSEAMFENMQDVNRELTLQQHTDFKECMKQ